MILKSQQSKQVSSKSRKLRINLRVSTQAI